MGGAETLAGSGGDALGIVKRGNITPGEPEPSSGTGTGFASGASFCETLRNGGGDFGAQAGGIKIRLGDKEILAETFGIGFESDNAAGKGSKFVLENSEKALAAKRYFRARRGP